MNLLLKVLDENKKYNDLIYSIKKNKSPIEISGLSAFVKATFIANIFEKINKPIIINIINN